MTSMIKNHNERPKSEFGGLPPVQFRLQINCGKTSPALPQLSAVKKIKLN